MNNIVKILSSLAKSAKFDESIDLNIILLKVPTTLLKIELPSTLDMSKVLLISRVQDIKLVKTISDTILDTLNEKEIKHTLKNKTIIIDPSLSQKILRAYGKYLSKYKLKPFIFNQTIERTLSNIPSTKKVNINKTSLSLKVGKFSEIEKGIQTLSENILAQYIKIKEVIFEISQAVKFKKAIIKTTMGKSYEITI